MSHNISQAETVIIPGRFRGPPDSANGGYACGVLGCRVHGSARVRLNRPPPLDHPLMLRSTSADSLELLDDDTIIAQGSATTDTWDVPPHVDFDLATHASARFPWFTGHPFPTCFVCGPERVAGDGLRILPGAITERQVVAAPWVPSDTTCDASGAVQPEIVWAALDCPSWFGIYAFQPDVNYALLGQLAARIVRRPASGEACVVIGWAAGRDGRKLHGGTAIFADGELLASSSATWIELRKESVTSET